MEKNNLLTQKELEVWMETNKLPNDYYTRLEKKSKELDSILGKMNIEEENLLVNSLRYYSKFGYKI